MTRVYGLFSAETTLQDHHIFERTTPMMDADEFAEEVRRVIARADEARISKEAIISELELILYAQREELDA